MNKDKDQTEDFQNNQINPFQLIRKLHDTITAQKDTLQQYKNLCDSCIYQKNVAVSQLSVNKKIIQKLKNQLDKEVQQRKDSSLEIQHMKTKMNRIQKASKISTLKATLSPSRLLKTQMFVKEKPIFSQVSLNLDFKNIQKFQSPPNNPKVLEDLDRNSQFIPGDIKLVDKRKKSSFFNTSNSFMSQSAQNMGQTITQGDAISLAQFFLQDFIVIGPDISQFKKIRQKQKGANELILNPHAFFNMNHQIRTKKPQTLTQIQNRCFPYKITAKKIQIQSYQQLKHVIQFQPNNKMSHDYFIFNLINDCNQPSKNMVFKEANINETRFVVVLKIPDFIYIRDEKHYQRKEQQVWLIQKAYTIVTYYPFFNIHIKIMNKIYQQTFLSKIQKILLERDNFLVWGLSRNIIQAEKNQKIRQILHYFMNKRIDYGQVLFYQNQYFGSIPGYGKDCEYAIAKFCAPIFFTNFSYEQMLFLITGIFCQKSLIFISQNESVASLCSLFLINILSPFPYRYFTLINSDESKIQTMIFEYPFPMISTIKKTQKNVTQILQHFSSMITEKQQIKQESSRGILIDIDSNSIMYNTEESVKFQQIIYSPSEQLHEEYLKINSSNSKSFSFPKKMPIQSQPNRNVKGSKTSFQKKREQIKRLVKDFNQKLQNNKSKNPSFNSSNQQIQVVIDLIGKYIKSFAIDRDVLDEILNKFFKKNPDHKSPKQHLLQKHPNKQDLIQTLVKSQMFADYLDKQNLNKQ